MQKKEKGTLLIARSTRSGTRTSQYIDMTWIYARPWTMPRMKVSESP